MGSSFKKAIKPFVVHGFSDLVGGFYFVRQNVKCSKVLKKDMLLFYNIFEIKFTDATMGDFNPFLCKCN